MTIATRAPRMAHATHDAPCPSGDRRTRRVTKRMALLIAAPLLVLGLAACEPTPQQESVRSHVNDSRSAHGLPALGDDLAVRLKAQAWAEQLAAKGSLSHSTLGAGLEAVGWVALAENVGAGSSVGQVHQSYMSSSRHRANILDRRWDRVGAGHAVGRDGLTYTVQVFVDLG